MSQAILDKIKKSRRILVIKQRYVGDSVWTLPFLENLKLSVPEATLAVVANVGADGFFYRAPYIDAVIPYPHRTVKSGGLKGAAAFIRFIREVRRFRADLVIELTDTDKSAVIAFLSGASTRIGYHYRRMPRHRLLNYLLPFTVGMHWAAFHLEVLERLGLKASVRDITIDTPESAFASLRLKAPALFEDRTRKTVLLHPGARVALRQWGTANFARLGDLLAADYRVVVVTGPDEEPILAEVLDRMVTTPAFSSSTLSLQEFAALCRLSDLFVGNDSGPIHIAATKTFTVGLYGPNCDEMAGPWTERKYVFEDPSLSCRKTCDHRSCTNESFQVCLSVTTPEAVLDKVREVLAPGPAVALKTRDES